MLVGAKFVRKSATMGSLCSGDVLGFEWEHTAVVEGDQRWRLCVTVHDIRGRVRAVAEGGHQRGIAPTCRHGALLQENTSDRTEGRGLV